MPADSATRVARLIALVTGMAFVATTTAGCDTINDLLPGGGEPEVEVVVAETDLGPCLPTYGNEVLSASMSGDGSRIVFVSAKRPQTLPDEAAWRSSDRALYVLNISPEGTTETNLIATSWPAPEDSEVRAASTAPPAGRGSSPEPGRLEEHMVRVKVAKSGDRFLVGATRQGSSGMVKLYTGMVPDGDEDMRPGEGLTKVPINDVEANQYIQSFHLSDDGSRVAAVVGGRGEVRVYDFDTDTIWVYEVGEGGETIISHDMPSARTDLDTDHNPAITSSGTMRVAWAPGGRKLSFSRPESVGTAGVWILDTDTGETTFVRGYRNTTVPWVAWSTDGGSVFIMSTTYDTAQTFGDSEVRRVAAEANGQDIGDRWRLDQDLYYHTAPADFVAFGDDSNFLFHWEYRAWVLEVPASGVGPAAYGPVTLKAPSSLEWADDDKMAVNSNTLSAALNPPTAAFVVTLRNGSMHVGQRLHALDPVCPLEPVPVETGDTATEPEGAAADEAAGEAAPAEGNQAGEAAPAEGNDAGEAAPAEGEGGDAPEQGATDGQGQDAGASATEEGGDAGSNG
ncbi:MAG: hypothetical protein ACK2UL_09390 [Anaerolineae bacterium]